MKLNTKQDIKAAFDYQVSVIAEDHASGNIYESINIWEKAVYHDVIRHVFRDCGVKIKSADQLEAIVVDLARVSGISTLGRMAGDVRIAEMNRVIEALVAHIGELEVDDAGNPIAYVVQEISMPKPAPRSAVSLGEGTPEPMPRHRLLTDKLPELPVDAESIYDSLGSDSSIYSEIGEDRPQYETMILNTGVSVEGAYSSLKTQSGGVDAGTSGESMYAHLALDPSQEKRSLLYIERQLNEALALVKVTGKTFDKQIRAALEKVLSDLKLPGQSPVKMAKYIARSAYGKVLDDCAVGVRACSMMLDQLGHGSIARAVGHLRDISVAPSSPLYLASAYAAIKGVEMPVRQHRSSTLGKRIGRAFKRRLSFSRKRRASTLSSQQGNRDSGNSSADSSMLLSLSSEIGDSGNFSAMRRGSTVSEASVLSRESVDTAGTDSLYETISISPEMGVASISEVNGVRKRVNPLYSMNDEQALYEDMQTPVSVQLAQHNKIAEAMAEDPEAIYMNTSIPGHHGPFPGVQVESSEGEDYYVNVPGSRKDS